MSRAQRSKVIRVIEEGDRGDQIPKPPRALTNQMLRLRTSALLSQNSAQDSQ